MADSSIFSMDRLRFSIRWIRERLWVRPLAMSLLSIGGIFLAGLADDYELSHILPEINLESVIALLTIMASSMLVIATFAVGSMVSAYASASTGATPRSFSLVVADDVTQNALSAFVGAFIFSLVSLIGVRNAIFDSAGLFAMFSLTVLVFVVVIATFVRWVDRIARLGRVTNTIGKVEQAAADALDRRRHSPTLGGLPIRPGKAEDQGSAVFSETIGYVRRIDMNSLQSCAEEYDCRVTVTALPGTFVSGNRPLVYIQGSSIFKPGCFVKAFEVGPDRAFEEDPRFGLLALSEIAAKALSSGINDPGTAINIIGAMVRLFTLWQSPLEQDEAREVNYDRVAMPKLVIEDLFDDAFTSIAREGAGIVEVSIRLQKGLEALTTSEDQAMVAAAKKHSRMALGRSERAMSDPNDIEMTRRSARFSDGSRRHDPC